FLNALKKLPDLIGEDQKKLNTLERDLPVLERVVNDNWSKDTRLSELKTELAAVERKIQLSLTPEQTDEQEKEEPQEADLIEEAVVLSETGKPKKQGMRI